MCASARAARAREVYLVCVCVCVCAGKSSTLRVLSGQSAPTAGDARVNGLSVISAEGSSAHHQKLVGYCPQVGLSVCVCVLLT